MKLDFIIAAILILLFLGITGTMDMHDQQAEAAHKAEIIAAAKAEFKKRQDQEKFTELYRRAERMTFPVSSYQADGK